MGLMPYIVTTTLDKRGPWGEDFTDTLGHRAVATLDEAREHIKAFMTERFTYGRRYHADADEFVSESGGTVGPLPDGTVIAVRLTDWMELAGLAGWTLDYETRRKLDAPAAKVKTTLLDAFNGGG